MTKQLDSSSQDEMSEIALPNKYSLGSNLSDFGVPENIIDRFMETYDASHLLHFCQEPESKNQLSELLNSFAPNLRSMMSGDQARVALPSRGQNEHEANQRANDSQDEMSEIALPNKYSLGSKLYDLGVPEDMIDKFMETYDASHLLNVCQEPERKDQLFELLNSFAPYLRSMMIGDQARDALPSRVQDVHEADRRKNESLAYLLEHAAKPNTPKLYEVDIEVYDGPSEIQDNLPKHKSIHYMFEEDATVSIERGAFEDSTAGGGAGLPQSSLMSTTQRRLSIKVNQERTEGNKRCTLAPKFPQVVEEDRAFPFRGTSSPTKTKAQPDRHLRTQTYNVCLPVPKREIEEVDRSQYSIDESKLISFGGYGRVYEGKWKGKSVAVKRVQPFEKSMTKSLETEIRINELVDHRNIVVLHAFSKYQPGKTSYFCFDLIMELIDGFNLNDAVFEKQLEYLQTDRGKLTTAKKVSDAIAHIHAKGYTHSDIKSDNILIRILDNEPFVCDLGCAHGVSLSKIASSGRRDVLAKWAPPESFTIDARGLVATYEGDVWCLACVLLELFTGHFLWEDEHGQKLSQFAVLARFYAGNVTPDILSLVDIAAVRDALQSCFTKIPQERPSAKKLTDIFEGALSSVNM